MRIQPGPPADAESVAEPKDIAQFVAPHLHPAQRTLYESLPDGVLLVRDGRVVFANRAAGELLGAPGPSALEGRPIASLVPDAKGSPFDPRTAGATPGGRAEVIEIECVRLDGAGCTLEVSVSTARLGGRPAVQALLRDATARRLQHALQSHVRRVLEMMADDAPLAEILRTVCRSTEHLLGGTARCGVLMLDAARRRMLDTATGSLPAEYCRALDGLPIGPEVGSCGRAIHLNERVVAEDIAVDPLWAPYRAVAARHGLGACFATPLRDPDGVAVGSFSVYHDRPYRPGRNAVEVVDAFVRLAEEALRRDRLRETMRRDRMRHESVLQAVGAAVLVFHGDATLAGTNPGAQRLLGLDETALAGHDARRLFDGAIAEDGTPLEPGDSPLERCLATRLPQRDRVVGLLRQDGGRRWVSVNAHPIAAAGSDDDAVVCSMADITAIKSAQQRLEQLARTDVLTGLPNRLHFRSELSRRVAIAERVGHGLGILALDLNGFKHVNDTLGHAAGDALLVDVAQRLEGALLDGETLARVGGDEFVVLTGHGGCPERLRRAGERLLGALAQPFVTAGVEVFVSAAVGGSVYPLHATTPEALARSADAAMYRAKRFGRAEVEIFGADAGAPPVNRLTIETELRHALQRGEFELHYQPRYRAREGTLAGVEALIRWRHPARGLVGPNEFVPIAEDTGLIVPIGRWVIEEACRQHRAWRDAGLAMPPIAVNVSAGQFGTELFAVVIPELLRTYDVPASALEVEITETVMMRQLEESESRAIDALRAQGLALLLDDFGTGYSSLSYLQRFPLDGLKIDRSFVAQLPEGRNARAVVEAILSLARSLGLVSIAEGVEDAQQADWLREAGCAELQGFLFARPMPAAEVTALLERSRG
ncbi:MAG TPA: EAL domain-containing protein [Burkholderiaceae bacterium]|nr:EAL domain-containing protein [Burkholderiaceae bacterium]